MIDFVRIILLLNCIMFIFLFVIWNKRDLLNATMKVLFFSFFVGNLLALLWNLGIVIISAAPLG